MKTHTERKFRMRSCRRCGGDAYLDTQDGPEWRCLQCARRVTFVAAQTRPTAAKQLQAA